MIGHSMVYTKVGTSRVVLFGAVSGIVGIASGGTALAPPPPNAEQTLAPWYKSLHRNMA
jgi:hypothetical protein